MTLWQLSIDYYVTVLEFGRALVSELCHMSFIAFVFITFPVLMLDNHTPLKHRAAVSLSTIFMYSAIRQGIAKYLELALSGALFPLFPLARPISVVISITVLHLVLATGFSRLSWTRAWASAETLSILLIIGCVELNPGPNPPVSQVCSHSMFSTLCTGSLIFFEKAKAVFISSKSAGMHFY